MSEDAQQDILGLGGEERYDYFINQVVEDREIWILVNADQRFLKIVAEDGDYDYLPVWPSADFAVAYAQGSADLVPKSISLPDFFRKWVPGLTRDGLDVGVFPGLDQTLWITEPEELRRELQDELTNV